jgi:transaldolase
MAGNPLRALEQCGQSIWTDTISRQMIASGALARYIERDGISGVTANPAIFEKAIAGSHDYDDTIRELASTGCSPLKLYETLALEDVGSAADILRPVYDHSGGKDGFVSIEVSPDLAYDTSASIEEAHRFWSALHRPNVMIKVPATVEGIPAIEQLTAEGINVNITLIFAVEVYKQVIDAYLKGLEHRVHHMQPIDHIASVASFFVSRVDTLVDDLLEQKAKDADEQTRDELLSLEGKAAWANAKIAYQWFERVFKSDRFAQIAERGGQAQRPLWASTSTKNPAYPDTLYVTPLIGPHTVNTMTLETIDAFRDHGQVDCEAIRQGGDQAVQTLQALEAVGINLREVTDRLTIEGVAKFSQALHRLLSAIAERQSSLVGA